jgi:hypothetical protein
MKLPILLNKVRLLVFAMVVLLLAISIVIVTSWRSSAVQTNPQVEAKRQFHARIRDGVGREVQFASPGDPTGRIRASVDSVDNFIFKRSGVRFGGTTKNRLADMEQHTLNGETRRLSVSDLNDVLTSTAFARLATLKDDDILHVDDALRGFNAPDLPKAYSRGSVILPGHIVAVSKEKFVSQVKAMRDQTSTPLGDVLRGAMHRAIEDNVQSRVSVLSEAVPEQFGGAWDVGNNREGSVGMTPIQAVLIAYAVASQDLLCDSQANLSKRMKGIQEAFTARHGAQYPSAEGHFAFGVNGYLTSTPLDLEFDDQTINRMLDHIQERSAR